MTVAFQMKSEHSEALAHLTVRLKKEVSGNPDARDIPIDPKHADALFELHAEIPGKGFGAVHAQASLKAVRDKLSEGVISRGAASRIRDYYASKK